MAGVVTKPISGGLDLVSKTAEGIKNNATVFDEEIKEPSRSRTIRPFYTSHNLVTLFFSPLPNKHTQIKNFKPVQSNVLRYIRTVNDGQFAMDTFLDLYYEKVGPYPLILFMSEKRIVCIYKEQVLWELSTSMLKLVEVNGREVILHYSDGKNVGQQSVRVGTEANAFEVQEKLNQLIQP